jgi:hypothetical protein
MWQIAVAEDPTTSGSSHLLTGVLLGVSESDEVRNRLNSRCFLFDFGSVPGAIYARSETCENAYDFFILIYCNSGRGFDLVRAPLALNRTTSQATGPGVSVSTSAMLSNKVLVGRHRVGAAAHRVADFI